LFHDATSVTVPSHVATTTIAVVEPAPADGVPLLKDSPDAAELALLSFI
jgi:hypothetical protein